MKAPILIVGFGNSLMGDDGAGPELVERLRRRPLERLARVEEGGSDASRLASMWRGEAEVWLVDAAARGDAPGTVHRLGHDTLLALPQRHDGAHGLSLPECLRWVRRCEPGMSSVRFRLWGIEPQCVRPGRIGLSPAVGPAVDAVAAEIVGLLDPAPAAAAGPGPTGRRGRREGSR